MKRFILLLVLLLPGILVRSPQPAAASGIQYDAHGRPFVIVLSGNERVRVYCRKAFFGAMRCPVHRKGLKFGPYDRDFAFSQGHQILR